MNLLVALTAAVLADELEQWWNRVGAMAVWVEFPLMLTLLVLYGITPILRSCTAWAAWSVVLGLVWAAASSWYFLLPGNLDGQFLRWLAWSTTAWGATWAYFEYRSAKHSPAIVEARLQALTARIRPHFFFNSLNAVLAMIRSDPRRAEAALEELADLFRVLMRDNRELVSLEEEVGLCQRYLDLESLRLGDRLQVRWEDADCPQDALVPPLMLQPLLENAVYHGIEPSEGGGIVEVLLQRKGMELHLVVTNPISPASVFVSEPARGGSRIALANLRERLMLFFDLEASMSINETPDSFTVRIRLPYRTSAS